MSRRILWGVAVALLAALTAFGIGATAYRAGVAHGLSEGARLSDAAPAAGAAAYPYWYHAPYPYGHAGFLFPLVFVFLAFALARGLFWGRRCGGFHGGWRGGVPPSFEEWHRRAHEGMN
jgi:hypothetical protein